MFLSRDCIAASYATTIGIQLDRDARATPDGDTLDQRQVYYTLLEMFAMLNGLLNLVIGLLNTVLELVGGLGLPL